LTVLIDSGQSKGADDMSGVAVQETETPSLETAKSSPLPAPQPAPIKRVLNAGSGPLSVRSLHAAFVPESWQETRLDIDAANRPDVVGSITDMSLAFLPKTFDAVWSSHILEHLYAHQVASALQEFRRVLKPDGFAFVTSPDIEAVAALIVEKGLDYVAYMSPAGPITALDMLYGHSASIAHGRIHMAHKSGFTTTLLGQRLVDAGFSTVYARRDRYELWALALMEQADKDLIRKQLADSGVDMIGDD
jgi:SAM-dependent methyltransferase